MRSDFDIKKKVKKKVMNLDTAVKFCYRSGIGWVCYNIIRLLLLLFIIIIISALSNPRSQTQASLSIPSLHPKTQIKEEKKWKNNRRESLPRSDRRGGGKIKQEQKAKAKTRHAHPRDY